MAISNHRISCINDQDNTVTYQGFRIMECRCISKPHFVWSRSHYLSRFNITTHL
ncbi:MAG: hypothetical protein ACXWC7_02685 [Chitinophagaceae bacterium]